LKLYKKFSKHTEAGLNLIQYLQARNYPTNNLILSTNKKPYIIYRGRKISLFGFIKYKKRLNLNKEQVKELGRYLGKLHALTRNRKLPKNNLGWDYFHCLICNHYRERKKALKRLQEILEYVYNNFNNVKCELNQPQAANHGEFTPEHVRFKENKLVHVIDWDIINKDFCFYDLGTAMISCFTPKKLDYKKVNAFLKAYNKERRLTRWEKEHVFEALQYGCFKFCIWTLTNPRTNRLNLNYKWPADVDRVTILMRISKEEFQQRLMF